MTGPWNLTTPFTAPGLPGLLEWLLVEAPEEGGGETNEAVSGAIMQYGPAIMGGFLIILVAMYFNQYMVKWLSPYKIKGGKYVDTETFDFASRGFRGIVAGALMLLVFILEGGYWLADEFGPYWDVLAFYVDVAFLIPIILFVANVLVRLLHNFFLVRFGGKKLEEADSFKQGVTIGELLLKYFIYLMALVLVVPLMLTKMGQREMVSDFTDETLGHVNEITFIVVVLFFVYLVERFLLPSVLTDMRRRGYSPLMLEGIKVGAVWAIRAGAAVAVLYTVLTIFGLENIGLIFIVFIIVMIALVAAVTLATPYRNIYSGVQIISNRHFDVGDNVVILGDMECQVVRLTLQHTHVRTPDGQVHQIPNGRILESSIINLSSSGETILSVDMDFHSSHPNKKIKSLLVKAAFTLKETDRRKPPKVTVRSIRGDVLNYQLTVRVKSPKSLQDVRSKLICRVQDELLEYGISDPLKPKQ